MVASNRALEIISDFYSNFFLFRRGDVPVFPLPGAYDTIHDVLPTNFKIFLKILNNNLLIFGPNTRNSQIQFLSYPSLMEDIHRPLLITSENL